MSKRFILIALIFFVFNRAFAQKDTIVYYLKNTGETVAIKDSADFFRVILPLDTSTGEALYPVKEFYKDGKIKLAGSSFSDDLNMVFQGGVITYFHNGHRKKIETFEDGDRIDSSVSYTLLA